MLDIPDIVVSMSLANRYILQVAYVLALFWYLIRTGSSVKQLPDLSSLILPKLRIGKLIPVAIIALLLVADFSGQGIVLLLLMLATIWIMVVWRRKIELSLILIGPVITAIAFLGGLPFWQNQFVGQTVFIGLLVFVMPMFVACDLLHKRTGLGGSQLYLRQYGKAMWSFLLGCLLFVPFGLFERSYRFTRFWDHLGYSLVATFFTSLVLRYCGRSVVQIITGHFVLFYAATCV